MEFDLEQTDALLTTTRAVRKRLDLERPVPREIVAECLEIAIQAPTASNSQTWRWIVVDDAALRARIADLYRLAMDDRRSVFEAWDNQGVDAQTARVLDSAGWLKDNLQRVPVLVIPCVEGRFGAEAGVASLAATFGSILPAVWNFQLALRARGLGSTLTTVHLFREREMSELLGLPEDVMQCALLPVAYTKGTDFKRAARPPAGGITHWNGW